MHAAKFNTSSILGDEHETKNGSLISSFSSDLSSSAALCCKLTNLTLNKFANLHGIVHEWAALDMFLKKMLQKNKFSLMYFSYATKYVETKNLEAYICSNAQKTVFQQSNV